MYSTVQQAEQVCNDSIFLPRDSFLYWEPSQDLRNALPLTVDPARLRNCPKALLNLDSKTGQSEVGVFCRYTQVRRRFEGWLWCQQAGPMGLFLGFLQLLKLDLDAAGEFNRFQNWRKPRKNGQEDQDEDGRVNLHIWKYEVYQGK